jgi:hypothetical protein
MLLRVDLACTPAAITLEAPEDCARFQAEVSGSGDAAHLDAALAAAGVGRGADGDDVWVSVDSLRAMAAGRVGQSWDTDFAAMMAYASAKGWLNEDGTAVRAHVERSA